MAFLPLPDMEILLPLTSGLAVGRDGAGLSSHMGSTAKMGAGTNVQDRLVALHDLDCPWRPGDVGRILRTFKIKKNVEVTDNGKIII